MWSAIVSLLGIFMLIFIIKGIFSLIIETATSSLYPNYNPLEDKILMKAKTLDKAMTAEEFSENYSCNYLLVIKMLTEKKMEGYKKDGMWYVGAGCCPTTHGE